MFQRQGLRVGQADDGRAWTARAGVSSNTPLTRAGVVLSGRGGVVVAVIRMDEFTGMLGAEGEN